MSLTRATRARWLAFGTTVAVVALAALFSLLRNLPAPPTVETMPVQRALRAQCLRASLPALQATPDHDAMPVSRALAPAGGAGRSS